MKSCVGKAALHPGRMIVLDLTPALLLQFDSQSVEFRSKHVSTRDCYNSESLAQPCKVQPRIAGTFCRRWIVLGFDQNNLSGPELNTPFSQTFNNGGCKAVPTGVVRGGKVDDAVALCATASEYFGITPSVNFHGIGD